MRVQQPGERLEVPRRRWHDTDVHHHRLDDHPGDLARVREQHAPHGVEPAERHDVGRARRPRQGSPRARGRRSARRRRARFVGFGVDGDGDGVVVAVVAALDLDDAAAAGGRAHEVNRRHRGLGAGVGEPPQRQPEAAGQLGGDGHDVRHRLGEVCARGGTRRDGGDDRRVGVAGERGAEAVVQVDVLGAVDVPDPRPLPALDEHRARRRVLPRRRDAAGKVGRRRDVQFVRPGRARQQRRFLLGDQARRGRRSPGRRAVLRWSCRRSLLN